MTHRSYISSALFGKSVIAVSVKMAVRCQPCLPKSFIMIIVSFLNHCFYLKLMITDQKKNRNLSLRNYSKDDPYILQASFLPNLSTPDF